MKIGFLRRQIVQLKKKLKEYEKKLSQFEKEKKRQEKVTEPKEMRATNYGNRWTTKKKQTCLGLYLKSRSAYKHQQKFLKLPHPDTLLKKIRRTYQEVSGRFGVFDLSINKINFGVLEWSLWCNFIGNSLKNERM